MAERRLDDLTIENARIIYRNFSGKGGQYNAEGNRNFCVVIEDPVLAERLAADGWNIKRKPGRDEGDDDWFHMQVSVRFDNIPPKIVLVTKRKKVTMDELMVDSLDYAEISNVDLIIHPSNYTVRGVSGVKAYLKTMYITIVEDVFADKYADEEMPFDAN